MHIVIISGSHRKEGSYKASLFIESRLQDKGCTTELINLADTQIPLRSQNRRNSESEVSQDTLQPIREKLIKANGFVVVSPERSGMVTPGLKNFFLIASSQNEFAHKPAMIVGVSSGTGGAYPIAELRMSSYKNTKIAYIPDHVIVRDIDHVLDDHDMAIGSEDDRRVKGRIDRSLDILCIYTQAHNQIRNNTDIDIYKHAYGM